MLKIDQEHQHHIESVMLWILNYLSWTIQLELVWMVNSTSNLGQLDEPTNFDAWTMLDFPGPRHSRFSLRCGGGVKLPQFGVRGKHAVEQPGGEQVDCHDISTMYITICDIRLRKISYIYIHIYNIYNMHTHKFLLIITIWVLYND